MKKYLLASALVLAGCAETVEPVAAPSAAPASAPATAAAAPVTGQEDSAALAALFEAYDEAQLEMSPMSKAYRGIIDEDYGRWDDITDAAAAAEQALDAETLAEMRARFDPDELSADDRLSYLLFEDMVARDSAAYEFRENDYLFDQMRGLQSFAPAFLINIHRVADLATAEAYVSRLRGLDELIDQALEEAREGAARGVLPPRWVYPYVISDARNVITGAPFDSGEDSPLFADLQEKVAALDIAGSEKARLVAEGRRALLENVGPAYRRLIALMEEQQRVAPTDDGVWRLPDGARYYAERLGYYTTTDLAAEEIHQLGLDNVARIHREMRAIMDEVGFEGSLQEFFEFVRTDERFFYDTREEYLADTRAVIAAMEKALPGYFDTLPKADLIVKPVEEFREKSAGKAFYQRPAPDGSRPGIYYVNLYNLKDMSKNELEALAYHEALPGHHMQLSIQTELGDVPAFRKFGGITAYSEGWGLYSEELPKEMGFYTDPYSDFGRLGMELWRAARLVVDTGIHHKRWSREQAIRYLQDNTPNPQGDIRKAIERYIVFPGQATAYMIGKLKILELRGAAQARLGERFTMGGFHDAILLSGPVPLDIMEDNVEAYVRRALMMMEE
ncbi:MAG: DUF885 family protein [Sphingomonadaceae bacterium]